MLTVHYQLIKKNNIPSGVYNICDDDQISTKDLVKLIAQIYNIEILIFKIPVLLIKLFCKIGDIFNLNIINSEKLKKITESYIVSNQKIKKVLKINKMPIKLNHGLINTIKLNSNNANKY